MTEVKIPYGDNEIILQTGKLAKQAHGAVTLQLGGTVVLVTAVCNQKAREGSASATCRASCRFRFSTRDRRFSGTFNGVRQAT